MATKKTTKVAEAEVKAETPVVVTEKTTTEKPQVTPEATQEAKEEKKTTKAGKHSEKALKEAEEKEAKEERKAKGDTTPREGAEAKVSQKQNPTRTRLERRGKAYRKAAELLEAGKTYSLKEAVALATKTSVGKFDATVEVHVNLNVDPRQADQNLRGTVSLPHGTGKVVRVAAFVGAEQVEAAKKAGADVVGEEAIMKLLEKQQLDFDVLVSTPQMMPKLGKYARVLGPRGLMPNPKAGTVTASVAKAVQEAKAGRVEYRVDKQSIIHLGVGKKSFTPANLYDNAKMFLDTLSNNKPASVKGALIKSVSVTTTMGPGIKVDISAL
jgi:large subunit ribosomal protein L1